MAHKIKFIEVSSKEDVSAIVSIAYNIWREHYAPIIGLGQVAYMLDKFQSHAAIVEQLVSGYKYYLLEEAGTYIGYLSFALKRNELFLSKLYIDSAFRRKGIAKLSLNYIREIAKNSGVEKLSLTVNKNNTGSIEAYKKMGFSIVKSVVNEIGGGYVMDDYIMELPLLTDISERKIYE